MSGFGRFGLAAGRTVSNTARRIEVAVGMLMVFGGILVLREIGQIVSGTQPVSGARPGVIVAFLLCVAAVAIGYGIHIVRKGF